MYVINAAQHLRDTTQKTENIVPEPAMPMLAEKGCVIVKLQEKIEAYRLAMSLAKSMLNKGIITQENYDKIDKIMTKKYGLSSSTIFR